MYNEYKEDSIMTEDTRKFVEEKTKEILNAGSCCPELKEMALLISFSPSRETEAFGSPLFS